MRPAYPADNPYARREHVAAFTAALDQFQAIDHQAINRNNAEKLFSRLS